MNLDQRPLASGFGATSTSSAVMADIDLRGRRAVITGGYSGLGLETTRALAAAGATVIVPARSLAKARQALDGLGNVVLADMDLLDPASIERFARDVVADGHAVDLLVGSAGIMATPLARDATGHESQFSANHLGHFALALQLWPALRGTRGSRIVSLSSLGHRFSGIDFEDPDFERRSYDKWKAYGQSKTANALFAVGLDRRGAQAGIRAFAVHPGTILTDLARHLTEDDFKAFGLPSDLPQGVAPAGLSVEEGGRYKSMAQGAATTLWCATSQRLDGLGGLYCENCDVAQVVAEGEATYGGVRPWAVDPELAERLWSLSERMTGLTVKS